MAKIKVTQTRSNIKRPDDQKRTLKALGLKNIGESVEHDDSAAVLGNGEVGNGAHHYPSTYFGGIAAGSFKIGFFRNENSGDRSDQLRSFFSFFE